MSGSNNNFTPASRIWQAGHDYGAYVPSSNGWNHTHAMYPLFGSVSFRADPNANRGLHHPWEQLLGEPMMLEPPGVPEPYSPPLIRVTDNGMAREIYPMQRPIIQGSPPRFMNQLSSPPRSPPRFMNLQNIQVPSQDSRLTPDEQRTALKKLKKEVYNPTPKKLMRGLSLYYRDNAKNIYAEKLKEKDNNDGKNCAVCLEDFEPREKVMLTPCNHMFHEECIVPWIKSNGQCPVCRFALCERITTSASANNFPNVQANDLLARELMTVIRAMEEAFIWGDTTR
ncbi:hypothetical protein Ddye_004498 [Dipteronia dyeriana]|uniref:RING-type domain-containing protein n=1 Tax=Dipteronia dyeriana TaxID=168575 RepID=A0AAD9XU84_9ROSI|nr:hypothetical protein Ddye_004498 [Dipteronia dyeriana]